MTELQPKTKEELLPVTVFRNIKILISSAHEGRFLREIWKGTLIWQKSKNKDKEGGLTTPKIEKLIPIGKDPETTVATFMQKEREKIKKLGLRIHNLTTTRERIDGKPGRYVLVKIEPETAESEEKDSPSQEPDHSSFRNPEELEQKRRDTYWDFAIRMVPGIAALLKSESKTITIPNNLNEYFSESFPASQTIFKAFSQYSDEDVINLVVGNFQLIAENTWNKIKKGQPLNEKEKRIAEPLSEILGNKRDPLKALQNIGDILKSRFLKGLGKKQK